MYRGQKRYSPTRGVDLKSSDILRPGEFLAGGENVRYDDQHNLVKRPGYQHRMRATSIYNGLYSFETVDLVGNKKKELLWLGDVPYRVVPTTMTIQNQDNANPLYVFVGKRATGSYIFELTRASSVIFSEAIGRSGPDTMAALQAAVDALANVVCTIQASGSSTYQNSLEIQIDEPIPPLATRTFEWYYLQAVNTARSESIGNPTIGINRNADEYAITSAVTMNNVLYVAYSNKYNAYNVNANVLYGQNISGLAKYDGQRYYLAGLPKPNYIASSSIGAATVTDAIGTRTLAATPSSFASWKYRVSYVQIDKAGNVIESPVSDIGIQGIFNPGDAAIQLSFNPAYNMINIAGYNNVFALCSSAMAGPSFTIPCDDGAGGAHTLKAGDVACFHDRIKGRTISRVIDSVTATDITISSTGIEPNDTGGAVQLFDNAVISNNLRIAIWRTKGTSGSYYLVREIPVRPDAPVSPEYIFYDQVEDSALGAILVEEEKIGGVPPFCNTVSAFGDVLVLSGNTKESNQVYYSERDNIENFPPINAFSTPFKVTGHGDSGGALAVFGESSVSTVTGDLPAANFRVETISTEIGCVAHATIKRVNESEIYFLSKKGPYRLIGGRALAPVGAWSGAGFPTSRLEPYFTSTYKKYDETTGKYTFFPRFENAIAEVLKEKKLYVLHVPWSTAASNFDNVPSLYPLDRYAGSYAGYPTGMAPVVVGCPSDTWVYDIGKDAWLPKWKDIDFSGGICEHNGRLWGVTVSNSIYGDLFSMNDGKGAYNYVDYGTYGEYSVDAEILTAWESLGEPDRWKKFLWLTVSSVGTRESATFSVDLESYPNFDPNFQEHTAAKMEFVDKVWKRVKLKSGKMNSIQFSMSNEDQNETFSISGWELFFAAPYDVTASASGGTQG